MLAEKQPVHEHDCLMRRWMQPSKPSRTALVRGAEGEWGDGARWRGVRFGCCPAVRWGVIYIRLRATLVVGSHS